MALGSWLYADAPPTAAFVLVPAWMFVRMAFNAIDGMLAREHHQQTLLGAFLNELTDVVSDAALYLPFAVVLPLVRAGPGGRGGVDCCQCGAPRVG